MKLSQRQGIMWALGAAIVSGISIYVNKFGVAQISNPLSTQRSRTVSSWSDCWRL